MKTTLQFFATSLTLLFIFTLHAQNPDCNQLQSSDFSFENIPCEANNLVVSALNEIPGATYTWNFGDGNTADGLTAENHYNNAGSYSVSQTVSLAGCPSNTISKIIDVEVFRPFTFNIGKNEKVCNPNEALAFVTYYGGKTPFTYQWSNGDKNRIARGLTSGEYSVTITDANGCQQIGSIELDVVLSPPMDITFNKKEEVCDPNETYLQANVTGGIQPLTYFWSNGETSDKIEGIGSDFYYVEVYDAIGCSQFMYDFFNVSQAPAITLTTQTNETVCNPSDASAKALASGGTPPFNYSWNTGATTAEISGIESGSYAVNVTDAAGCNASKSFQTNVVVSPTIQIDFDKKEQVCEPNEATIEALVSGGTGDLSINWNTGDQTTQLTAVTSGDYAIDVTDQLGCTASASTSIEVNVSPKMDLSLTKPETICSEQEAQLAATVVGGMSPVSFIWNNGATSASIANLSEGIYTVTAIDQYGCEVSNSASIAITPKPNTPFALDQVVCESGSVELTAEGDAEQFYWSTTNSYAAAINTESFTTPVVTENTVYYVGASNGACFSEMTQVHVIVQKRNEIVGNGGFEEGHPQLKRARIEKADGWYSAAGTPDAIDASRFCLGNCLKTIKLPGDKHPLVDHNHINPTGDRCAGLHAVSMVQVKAQTNSTGLLVHVNANVNLDKVEAIATKMSTAMEIGKLYSISFDVAKGHRQLIPDVAQFPFETAQSSKFVVKLSKYPVNSIAYRPTDAEVVFEGSTMNEKQWDKVQFTVVPSEAYQYIIIESVLPTHSDLGLTVGSITTKISSLKAQSYMLVDNVSVLEDCDGAPFGGLANNHANEKIAQESYAVTNFSDQESFFNHHAESELKSASLTSIESAQTALEESVVIAPNPNNGVFTLGFELSNLDTPVMIKTINAVGQVVDIQVLDNTTLGTNQFQVYHDHLPHGVYSLALTQGSNTATIRFVVQ